MPINPANAIPAIVGQNHRATGGSASGTGSGSGICGVAGDSRGARAAVAALAAASFVRALRPTITLPPLDEPPAG